MQQYDVSVVVPVYNCEKYIRKCVKSILNQDYSDLSKIQVILVDDGSTDKSLEICNKLKEEINKFTIEIISGENFGVSTARNKGIKAAKGKYILFLDADDMISKNAVRKLVKFFNKHYDEIDILTYPIYYYDEKTKIKMDRYKKFSRGTDVYDLDGEDYYLIQPNVNVMVKNYFENNILFDTNMKFHEDEKYNIDVIMPKMKIGYVDEVKYIYRRYGEAVTETKSNPYYCFEDYIGAYEYYIKKYIKENGKLAKCIQYTIINDFRWRLEQDKIFPYYLEGKEFNNAINRIKNILKYIDNETIVNNKYIDRYHKIYLLKLKDIKFQINTNHLNKFTINSNNDILDTIDRIEIVINRFKVKNGKIYILAYLKSPLLHFKKPSLYIKYIDQKRKTKKEEINLSNSTANLYKTNIDIAQFYMFEYEIDMDEVRDFEFIIKVDDNNILVTYYFSRYSSIDNKINCLKVYDKQYRVQFKNRKFFIRKPSTKTRIKDYFRAIKRYKKINPRINFFRMFAKTNKKIWIYNDRIGVFDNAYLQYKHDVQIEDGIKRYYALDGDINKYKDKFNKKELKNVIKFGSLKHKILFLKSDKIISSFSNMQEFCPLFKNYTYYKDILKYDLIYLQHGVLHATCLRIYSKEFTPLDKILISSEFEKNNFINKYKYSEQDLITCGMPRLDENKQEELPQNKIIFAPSWRNYLVGKMVNRKRKMNKQKFKQSKYYIEIVNFLRNETLLKVLKNKNIIIDFKLHPIFEKYKKCFDFLENDYIKISIGDTKLSEYKAFITDFSSFQFDFVNLERPIMYFVPDMEEFKSGLHLYRELDLKYEDAFGKLCKTGDELVDQVIKTINNDFKVEEPYKQRMETFFYKVDNRKDELYRELKRI